MRTVAVFLLALLLVSGCGGDDSPSEPGGGTGNETVTVISADVADDWEVEHVGTAASGNDYVGGVFCARAELLQNCDSQSEAITATSRETIDFTAFTGARAQFRATGQIRGEDSQPHDVTGFTLFVRSNETGTADLLIETGGVVEDGAFDQTYDLSLEAALGFQAATVEVYVSALIANNMGCDREAWTEVHDFRIIATK